MKQKTKKQQIYLSDISKQMNSVYIYIFKAHLSLYMQINTYNINIWCFYSVDNPLRCSCLSKVCFLFSPKNIVVNDTQITRPIYRH